MLRLGCCCWTFDTMDNQKEQDQIYLLRQSSEDRRRWHQKYLAKRSTTHKLRGIKKFIKLVLSPRTITLQLIAFLVIGLVKSANIQLFKFFIKGIITRIFLNSIIIVCINTTMTIAPIATISIIVTTVEIIIFF